MTKSIEKVSKSERAYVHLILTSQGQEGLSIVESAIDEYAMDAQQVFKSTFDALKDEY